MSASFTAVKQIDAGVLSVAYAEDGPTSGPAVLLLHGWPYDIHSYVETARQRLPGARLSSSSGSHREGRRSEPERGMPV
jgi:pimeloyl-ACP methyl ester carboxylesterase